jgi:AraC-like DNA-binding protein
VLSCGGLDEAADWDNQVVTRSQVCAMMLGLARMSGDATIGVQMAACTDPQRLGPFGRALGVGRSLREGLEMQQRFMPSLQRGAQVSLVEDRARAAWSNRLLDSDPVHARFLNEGIAAFVVRFVRAVSGEPEAPMHVTLPHRPLAPARSYEEALGCAVSFVPGPSLVVRFDASLLDRPNALRKEPEAFAPLLPQPGTIDIVPQDCLLDGGDLLRSLNRQIEAATLIGRVSVLDACRSLGMSPRTLQRRLAEMDTTFEDIVDCWRHQTAVTLLAEPGQRIGSIAAQLGYSDPAHFIRAFHRWEGRAPSDYRARHGIAAR